MQESYRSLFVEEDIIFSSLPLQETKSVSVQWDRQSRNWVDKKTSGISLSGEMDVKKDGDRHGKSSKQTETPVSLLLHGSDLPPDCRFIN
ncbi:hypothetical protein ZIOFF_014815 [Zingiber officinale]|uniref:Uncharacterized protein n=1 Tax=Zingiber officinale TaxID=94328 RepID=A0A8J5HC73_ZINOF|nr:hypothetical protein ZIOFF_014815 [Zingiber officinale]